MKLTTFIPTIIALFGLLLYYVSKESKQADTGRLMFIIGLSAVMAQIVLGVKW